MRAVRSWWFLRGFPSRSVLMLSSHPDDKKFAIDMLRRDLAKFQLLEKRVAEGAAPKYILERSIFHTTSVRQLCSILHDCDWEPDLRALGWLEGYHSRLLGSQIVEDALRDCRTCEHNSANRRATPKTMFAHLASSPTLTQRHKFDGPHSSVDGHARNTQFPDDAFKPSTKHMSIDCHSIYSTITKPHWFSPSAERSSLPFFDLNMLEQTCIDEQFVGLGSMWLGAFVCGRGIVISHPATSSDVWFPLGQVSDSAVILLRAVKSHVPGTTQALHGNLPGLHRT